MDFKEISKILYAGGVIIFPTETLYGLGCDATNPQALLKVYKIKNRQFGKTFPIIVKDIKMLLEYAQVNERQKKVILSTKMPTNFVLKAKNLSPLATKNKTAAFRISKGAWVKKLFKYFDRPLVATSANISGQPAIKDPRKHKEIFGKNADLIDAAIFAGINLKKKGSRIIDFTQPQPKVIRK